GREEGGLMGLAARVMARSPEAWASALGPLRRRTDEMFEEMVAHRLRLAGRDDTNADVIAAGLAAIVVRAYCNWVSGGCKGEFAERLQQGFRGFSDAIGLREST